MLLYNVFKHKVTQQIQYYLQLASDLELITINLKTEQRID